MVLVGKRFLERGLYSNALLHPKPVRHQQLIGAGVARLGQIRGQAGEGGIVAGIIMLVQDCGYLAGGRTAGAAQSLVLRPDFFRTQLPDGPII